MSNYLNWTGSGGSDTALLANQMPLLIEPILQKIYTELDPFFRDSIVTSEGVVRDPKISRDWLIRKSLDDGEAAGVVEMATNSVVYGPTFDALGDSRRLSKANVPGYPDPFESADSTPYQMTISLRGMRGACPWPIVEEDTDALPALIGDNYARLMTKWARQFALFRITHYYAADDSGKICDFTYTTTDESYSDPDGVLTVTVSSKNINNFKRGMQVDVYEGATQRNLDSADARVPVYVDKVHHFQNKVYLRYKIAASSLAPGSGGMFEREGLADTNTGSIYLRASKGDVFPGLNTFCKSLGMTTTTHPNYISSTGTLFGVVLHNHPDQQSLVVSAGNAALTESLGTKVLAKFQAHKAQYGQSVDTVLMRRGAYCGYVEARTPSERDNRQVGSNMATRSARGQGADGEFVITFNGLTCRGIFSEFLPYGKVFMVKTRDNNFKRYVPPISARQRSMAPPGFAGVLKELNGMEIQFMGKAMGHATEFVPVYDGDGEPKEAVQMLARSRTVMVPDQLACIKIEDVEETDVSLVA